MFEKTTFALHQCNMLSDCIYTIKSKQEIHTANNIYKWKIKIKIPAENHTCLFMMIKLDLRIECNNLFYTFGPFSKNII